MAISSVMGLAHIKAEWLSARQVLLSQNVANINSPGYKATDLASFSDVIQSLKSETSNGNADQFLVNHQDIFKSIVSTAGDASLSGNTVSIDNELLKISDTASQYSLTTNIIKSFHRMISASLKA